MADMNEKDVYDTRGSRCVRMALVTKISGALNQRFLILILLLVPLIDLDMRYPRKLPVASYM